MERKNIASFMKDFYTISNRLNQIRNTPITFYSGITVNSAGLSLINAIASNPAANMSEIGSVLGLTKGAISQMAAKLQAKGLIEKQKDKESSKDIYLVLTEKGKQVNEEQVEIRKKMTDGIEKIVREYSSDEIELLRRFLTATGSFMERYQHEISGR